MPSTCMTAAAVSTRMPCVRTRLPSTVTRPWSMSSSHARRDPTPAAASTFCRRTPSSFGSRSGFSRADMLVHSQSVAVRVLWSRPSDVFLDLRGARQQGGEVRELVQGLESHALQEVAGGAVQEGARLVLGAAFLHQAPRHKGAHDAVAVDPADGGDLRPADRLTISHDGQSLQSGLRELRLLAVADEAFDYWSAVSARVHAPAGLPSVA